MLDIRGGARVDVIMPAYNAAATIREAVESLLRQTLRDVRIVVIDDGSTDSTSAVLQQITQRDARVHVVTQPNKGIVEARNRGLTECTAEYVACLDADDTAFPERLERQLAYLVKHPQCVGVGGAVAHIDEAGSPLSGLPQPGSPSEADATKAPAMEPYIINSTFMGRRADLAAIGGYRHIPNSEDSDLFWRLAERGELVNLPEVFGKYRVHTSSASSSLVSGRVMAIGSQLGALSALRRRAKRADLNFTFEMLAQLKARETLSGMVALVEPALDADEVRHLRLAAGVKLLEMARYRPYEPDVSDCSFIRDALRYSIDLTSANRREIGWYVTVTAARLLKKGRWREAVALTPPIHYPIAAARLFLVQT